LFNKNPIVSYKRPVTEDSKIGAFGLT